MIPGLEISQLGKSYDTEQGPAVIVKDFNLRVSDGEFVCIIGHSGCGKSTVLSIAMGLNDATEGGIIIAGREVVGPGLDRGVVFQSSALLPWLTARENVLLAVDQVNPRFDRPNDARRWRISFSTPSDWTAWPKAIPTNFPPACASEWASPARLRLEPKVLLLDEPFSLLDVVTRMELQDQLINLCAAQNKTVLMVTHDVDEAILLADRIVMMTNGPAATVGEIVTVPFERPRDRITILDDPRYHEARQQLLSFLEERAGRAQAAPPPLPRPIADLSPKQVTPEELFLIEKLTGFNRFRGKYRRSGAAAQVVAEFAGAEVKALN